MAKSYAKQQALWQIQQMAEMYGEQIGESFKGSTVYTTGFSQKPEARYKATAICAKPVDTVSAIFDTMSQDVTVLNFASYQYPGGGFLNGSKAQEESLCHSSYLYNVLFGFEEFYNWNRKHRDSGLYRNRGIYTPGVVFVKDLRFKRVDVISVAAPNKNAALTHGVTEAENSKALESRIKFVLDIASRHGASTLILGAYGCGVFGQDPVEVANIFKKQLTTRYQGVFQEVIFAVPPGNRNYQVFNEVFGND